MSRSGRFLRLAALLLIAGWPPALWLQAAEPTQAPAVDPHPDLVRLSPVDEVWVDRERGEVIVGGRIVLTQGPIEFFACPRRTKEHESIVAVNAPARLVHAGLLAIGLTPGTPVSFDPEYRAATGPKVAVMLRWQDASGQPRETRACLTTGNLAPHWRGKLRPRLGPEATKGHRRGGRYHQHRHPLVPCS